MKQIVLITGTSTGLGFAAAVSVARAGHEVFATMRSPSRAPELAELAGREKLPITVVQMDVDDDDSVQKGVRSVLDARGRIDVLVNNAGIGHLGSIEETPLAEFRQVMETNYFGVIRCTQSVLPGMRERRSGRIINISSVAGKLATAGNSAYAASKFALEGLSDALACEMRAHNVRVNVIEPGVIATPIFGKQSELQGRIYPGARRLSALFAASLELPVPASVIGDQVRELLDDQSWQVRYPGGPAAAGAMGWRASLADEQFTAIAALDDKGWCELYENSMGVPVTKHLLS